MIIQSESVVGDVLTLHDVDNNDNGARDQGYHCTEHERDGTKITTNITRVRQTILRAEYSGFRIDFLLLLWAVIKIKNLFCASFLFFTHFFRDASLPPKEPREAQSST
jgi:hypothetical protein